jgi:sulfoxide reductase heme-binding subunit YedZ
MLDRSQVAAAARPSEPFATDPTAARLDHPPRPRPGARLASLVARLTARRPGPASRLDSGGIVVILAVLGLVAILETDQIVPATSVHQAQLRVWLASRAAGIVALVLLAIQIVIGLVLSHPTNKAVWRVSRVLFPWHDSLWLFTLAFVAAHVVSIVVDPWAGVGLAGAIVPGLSAFRTAPVALGTLALYALLVTGMTARWTRLLPPGAWLIIHRAGVGVFVIAWVHGLLAGTDSAALLALYVGLGVIVGTAATHRFWAVRHDVDFVPVAPADRRVS